MNISTVSFEKARIYKNKMLFCKNGSESVSLNILDNCGINIINRISHKPVKIFEGDKFIIIKKKEYEIPNEGTVFQTVKRIYDKTKKLLEIKEEVQKFKL